MATEPYEGYPTAQAPITVPHDYQTQQARPQDFGAGIGQGLEKLGAGATGAAKFFGQVVADDTYNQFVTQADAMLRGDSSKMVIGPDGQPTPDRGYLGTQGRAALDGRPTTETALENLRKQLHDNLQTPEQQLLFDQYSRRYQAMKLSEIGSHAEQQAHVWYAQVEKSSYDINRSGAADAALRGDTAAADAATGGMMASRLKTISRIAGGQPTDDMINSAMLDARRDAAEAQVKAVLQSDPARAQAIFDQNQHVLAGAPNFDSLSRELKTAGERAQDAALVRGIVGDWAHGGAASSGGGAPGQPSAGDPRGMIPVIRAAAAKYGIDPEIAVKVARSEGLGNPVGDGGTSHGALQLHVGGGLGDEFRRDTGLDPADPKNEPATIDYAMRRLNETGWTPYHGAARVGVGARDGIGAAPGAPAADRIVGSPENFDIASGDSIAVMQQKRGVPGAEADFKTGREMPGDARVGAPPQEVARRIDDTIKSEPNAYRDKVSFLSTGASNARDPNTHKVDLAQLAPVGDQVAKQIEAGAKAVVVPGVGPGVANRDEVNTQLKTAVEGAGGVFFVPQVKWQADGIHPAEPDKVRQQGLAALGQKGGAATAQPIPPGTASAQQAIPGFPTREDLINRIPEGLSDEAYGRVYAGVNRVYNRMVQSTSAERAQVEQQYKGGLAMLQDGREFSYDEGQIRRLFPAATASEMIGNLDDARTVGQQIVAVRGMSLPDIMAQHAANAAILSRSAGPDYARQRKLSDAFDRAAETHIKALGQDPVGYVLSTNPSIEAARAATAQETPQQSAALRGQGQPDAVESYAAKLLGEQDRLGVPQDQRHVLDTIGAQRAAAQITANPEQAPAMLKDMQQRWGSAWPQVLHDLTTTGKLPAPYQMVGALDNEGDGALLARALGHANKEGNNRSLDELLDKGATGTVRPSATIRTRVAGNEDVAQYARSLLHSGASDDQVAGIVNSITLLAQAKALYNGEKPEAAADHAVESAIGKYEFLPNGGARVPKANAEAILDNAHAAVAGLNLAQLQAPRIYADADAPGAASADDWLRVLKAAPNWITAGQSIRLMDNAGRFVRRCDGSFVEVPFSAAPRPVTATPPIAFEMPTY